jgi:Cu(I)/Ag(I) efflux system membrane protein CusA/SilA
MFSHIINWSIDNKFFVVLATLFLAGMGIYSLANMPLDAIPDLSDVQVIVYTEYPGQAPQIVEDQVTYPLTTQMLAVPYAKVVRGYSFFGFSFVYIIFEDGTDLYWARSRVLEYLNFVSGRLPRGVTPALGPDATGVGWAFMYALKSDRHDLSQLRSLQDWYLKFELTSVSGVSEVASVGGFVRQYQITVDPNKLRAYGIPISRIREAVAESNIDVGGRVLEVAEKEFMIRGLGYIRSLDDIRQVALGVSPSGTPILVRDVAQVHYGPDMRRGIAEWNGEGETVGGIVVVRHGANTRQVIHEVKQKLAEAKAGLPEGVEIEIAYDRTALIDRSIDTLREKLFEEGAVVALVCIIFLLHFTSAFVSVISLPLAVLISFAIMYQQGLSANIMSLGGIAIAIGAMVDAAIIMVENAHKHLEADAGKKPHWDIIRSASLEVGPSIFYALLVTTVSFMPVFTLQAQEGRLFKPLAFTKTYSMFAAAVLSITLVPVLMGYFIRGGIRSEEKNPISRFLIWIYHPILEFTLRFRWPVLALAALTVAVTWIPFSRLGSEFMPPLWEGDLLYMPTTLPGLSTTKARELIQQTDRILKSFPEVQSVFGKIGRAETATDPAPMSMVETTVILKPVSEWRAGMTPEKLVDAMNAATQAPGVTNAWTLPIRNRIDMLSTGIRTPVGIKVAGPDLAILERLGKEIEAVVRQVPGTRSVYAERVMGGNYIDFEIDRAAIARYGLTVADVQDVIQSAIGGMDITTTVEGLERYAVTLRYSRELRDDLPALANVLVETPAGQQLPLGQFAELKYVLGADMIRSEDARPNAWIYVDVSTQDIGGYVARAQQAVREQINLPAGYTLGWSGQYEYMQRAEQRLLLIVPLTLLIIVVILYLNTRSLFKTALVILTVPFSIAGGIWLLYLLDYNMSIAVWVGLIALAGLDAETSVVILLYLDLSYEEFRQKGLLRDRHDLADAVYHGAVKRIRPKMMTIATTIVGLLPILWSQGTGADVMKRIAAPMVGGLVTSGIMELAIYPVIYYLWKQHELPPAGPFRGFRHLRA